MPNHKWTKQDDLIILFIQKYGIENSPLTENETANKIGVSLGSIKWRIGNFNALNGIGNATHFAALSREVHQEYSTLSEDDLRKQDFS